MIQSKRILSELSNFSIGTSVTPDWLLEPVMVQLALQNCLSESEHHVLTQEEAEEEAVLWANLNKNGN